jgi:hypothetical protein
MAIVTIGIDLAKNVFAVHGLDKAGKTALAQPSVPRAKLFELIPAQLPSSEQSSKLGLLFCGVSNHSDWDGRWHLKSNLIRLFLREATTQFNELGSGLSLLLGDKYCALQVGHAHDHRCEVLRR